MKENRGFDLVCDICGHGFHAKNATAKRCGYCHLVVGRMKARLYDRRNATGQPYSYDEAIEMARAFVAEEEKRELEFIANGGASREASLPKCKYCGSTRHVSKHGFCKECVKEGYDNVYRITHRSNGWDRVMPKGMKVEGGWRGQRVIGCGKMSREIRVESL